MRKENFIGKSPNNLEVNAARHTASEKPKKFSLGVEGGLHWPWVKQFLPISTGVARGDWLHVDQL